MSPYTHLTLKTVNRYCLVSLYRQNFDTIAKEIGRYKSTVSREMAQRRLAELFAATAQDRYRRVRLASRRPRILDRPGIVDAVIRYTTGATLVPGADCRSLVTRRQTHCISYSTIYRGITR